MNEREYNEAEGIRRSDLWKMEESPERFKYFLEHPVEQTPAMAFGSAAHKLFLEPRDFGEEYAVAPNVDRRTKSGREEWESFQAANEGKTILANDDLDTIHEMGVALINCPLAYKLIFGKKGQSEVPIFWTDKKTGEKCKAKMDRVVTYRRRKYIVDYKTTMAADTFHFNSEVWKRGYYMQAAMYAEGMKTALKLRRLPGFLFVAQEKKPPYSVNVIEVSEEVMNAGIAKFHSLLEKYHACSVLDKWPGYVQDVPNDCFVPGWMMSEMEDEFE